MNLPVGNDAGQAAFAAALGGAKLHHAWLIAGPEGVGKASFARAASSRARRSASPVRRPSKSARLSRNSHNCSTPLTKSGR